MEELENPGFTYGIKKFVLYIMFAIPPCVIPEVNLFVLMLGAPCALLTAIFLSIDDVKKMQQNQNFPSVFCRAMWAAWLMEILSIIVFTKFFHSLI